MDAYSGSLGKGLHFTAWRWRFQELVNIDKTLQVYRGIGMQPRSPTIGNYHLKWHAVPRYHASRATTSVLSTNMEKQGPL